MRRAVVVGVAIGIALSSTVAYGSWQKSGTGRHAYARYASTFSCSAPGTVQATIDRDTFIEHGAPAGNFNTGNNGVTNFFQVASFAGGARRALLHFTLPSLPARCSVTAALMTLHYFNDCNNATPNQLNLKPITGTWAENTVTWNNQPTFSGQVGNATDEQTTTAGQVSQHSITNTDCTTLHTVTFSGGGFPASVQSLITGTNNGWEIQVISETAGSGNLNDWISREAGSGFTTLAVTFG